MVVVNYYYYYYYHYYDDDDDYYYDDDSDDEQATVLKQLSTRSVCASENMNDSLHYRTTEHEAPGPRL